jgi:hypothetical protein
MSFALSKTPTRRRTVNNRYNNMEGKDVALPASERTPRRCDRDASWRAQGERRVMCDCVRGRADDGEDREPLFHPPDSRSTGKIAQVSVPNASSLPDLSINLA